MKMFLPKRYRKESAGNFWEESSYSIPLNGGQEILYEEREMSYDGGTERQIPDSLWSWYNSPECIGRTCLFSEKRIVSFDLQAVA